MSFLPDISRVKELAARKAAPFLVVVAVILSFVLCVSVPGLGLAEPADAGSDVSIETSAETSGQADCVMSADEYENSVTAANMVLLVSFSDTSQNMLDAFSANYAYASDNIPTNWRYFMWTVDGMKQPGFHSWREYLYEISQGQCNVKSYFPQGQADGTMVHITLDRPASDYNGNDGLLVGDIASKFNAQFGSYDASKSDKNGDGFIDNLMIVPTSSEVFTSHKASLGETVSFGSGSNARKVKESITVVEGPLTLTDTGTVAMFGFSESVAVHEYLHTLGARDYYRNGIAGEPVGYWDVMSKGGVFSWPLAFTREQIGWATIPEVDLKNLKDSYTLYAPAQSDAKKGVSNPSKPQALKIKSPFSSSEYFIVEYRQQGATSGGYDYYIGASGLIVYRVNERYSSVGNIGGKDYVYVFRPGETGLNASGGEIGIQNNPRNDRAAIAAGEYVSLKNGKTLNTSIGSTDLDAKFTDGTIFFEDGSNSGIKVDAVSQTDGSITFKISTADYAQADMWEALTNEDGTTPFGTWSSPTVQATSDESSPYLLVGDGSFTSPLWGIWKHDGSNWQQLGQKSSDIRSACLVVMDGKPYLLGVSMSNKKQIVIKTLVSNQWQTLASATLGGEVWSTDLRAIGGKLYAFAGADGDCRMFALEGSTLKQYGSTLPVASSYDVSIADCGGQPLLVANDQAGKNTNAYRLSGSSWAVTTIKNTSSSVIESVTKDGKTYVYAFTYDGTNNDARLSVLSSSAAVEHTLILTDLQDATADTSLSAGKNNLYFVKSTSQGVKAYSLPYSAAASGNSAQLTQLGGTVFAGASSMDVVAVGDSVYCMLGDTDSSSVAVRYHKLQSGDTAEPLDPSQGGSSQPTTTSITGATAQVAAQTYTGKALTPKPTVKMGSVTLKEGTDYILEYRNNTNVGTATILIKGTGSYSGTKSVTFKINAASSGGNSGNTSGGNASGGSTSSGASATQAPEKAPAVTGAWKKSGGRWWFSYDSNTQKIQKKPWPANEWVKIGGKSYHFDKNGYMHSQWYKHTNNKWYWLGSDGAMRQSTWAKVSGKWYYLEATGQMKTGRFKVGGAWYYCDGSGAMYANRWVKVNNIWYWATGSGAFKTGWQKVSGKWYYLDPAKEGAMKTGFYDVGKTTYYSNSSGAMLTGWQHLTKDKVTSWYYFDGSGAMQKSKWIQGKYWVESDGRMATSRWVDNNRYYVDGSGKWVPNKKK